MKNQPATYPRDRFASWNLARHLKSSATRRFPALPVLALVAVMALSAQAQIQTAGTVFVNVDATALSPGVTADVANTGTLGGYFETNGVANSALITNVNGVNTISLNGGYMNLKSAINGPLIPPPAALCGVNPPLSIEVWALNPSTAPDECMVAWGVRSPSLKQMAFEYGNNVTFGAVQHLGSESAGLVDMGWEAVGRIVNQDSTPLEKTWHHLAYTYDGTTQRVYVDGLLANSRTLAFTVFTNAGIALGSQWSGPTPATTTNSTSPAFATLAIARVRIQNGSLSAAQVANNFNVEKAAFGFVPSAPLTAGPVHRYSFNEAATDNALNLTFADTGSSPAPGTVRGDATLQPAVFTGRRLVLPGGPTGTSAATPAAAVVLTSAYAYGDLPNGIISANSALNGGSGKLTIEVWYRPTAVGMGYSRVFDIGCNRNGTTALGYTYGIEVPTGGIGSWTLNNTWSDHLYYSAAVGGASNNRRISWGNLDPNPVGTTTNASEIYRDTKMMGGFDTDHHTAVTWDESTGVISVYENGVFASSITASNTMQALNDVNCWLGRGMTGEPGYIGEYDEVRFYNYVLTQAQVQGNFEVGPETVNTAQAAPAILSQPVAQSTYQGWPVTFSVRVSGSPAVSYQWLRNGAPISGANADTLSFAAALADDGATYSCLVSNFANGTPHPLNSTSAALAVTANVAPPPQFLYKTRDGSRNNHPTSAGGGAALGGGFTVGSTPVVVTHLGFYDLGHDGLNSDHHVGLYNFNGTELIASVVVSNRAASNAILTNNGYVYVPLDAPLLLAPNNYYVLAGEGFLGDLDGWPDGFNPSLWNPFFVGSTIWNTHGTAYASAAAAWPTYPITGVTGRGGNIYATANLAALPMGVPVTAIQTPNVVTQYATLSVTLTVGVDGQAPLTVQWFKAPSTPLVGQTAPTLTLSNLQASDAGDYYLVASNALNPAVQSGNITLVVLPDQPVSITKSPSNQVLPALYPATFAVEASGTTPLYYQWTRNTQPIPDATNATYNISVLSLTNNGDVYACVASNYANARPNLAVSGNATLTVIPNISPPTSFLYTRHTGQPRNNQDGTVGGRFIMSEAGGIVTHLGFTCPDQVNGLKGGHYVGLFSGDASNTLDSVWVPAGNAGVLLTNGFAWVPLTAPFYLTNNTAYIIGAEVVNDPLSDLWYDVANGGVTWSPYFLGNQDPNRYVGRWSNPPFGNPMTSQNGVNTLYGAPNIALFSEGPPVFMMPPVISYTQYVGFPVSMTPSVFGNAPMTGQWYKAPSTLLAGRTNLSLVFTNLTLADSGEYYVVALNGISTAQSANFRLTVVPQEPPSITQAPQDKTVYINQLATFRVTAGGTPALGYQWRFNGVDVPGATDRTVTIPSAYTGVPGTYPVTVVVTNGLGSTNSTANLLVVAPPAGSYASAVMNLRPLVYYQFSDLNPGPVTFNFGTLGSGHDGTAEGVFGSGAGPLPPAFANFDTNNTAVILDGSSTDVGIPALNLVGGPNVTMAAWVNLTNIQVVNASILFHRMVPNAAASGMHIVIDSVTGLNELAYHWNSQYYQLESHLNIPVEQWVFVALAVDPDKAVLYMNDGSTNGMQSFVNSAPHGQVPFAQPTYVGWDNNAATRRLNGAVDEPMIFGRTLSPSEINSLYVAGFVPVDVRITVTRSGDQVTLTWPGGTLQSSDLVTGTYTDMTGTNSPYSFTPSATQKYFRLRLK